MSDISIRIQGRAGRITLTRPKALNAMTYEMCTAIEAAFDSWADDPQVDLIILDAEGDRAFCSGGDIADLYAKGRAGDFDYGRTFWADEYRLNNKIYSYKKPVVSFLQGFTMGGGVGIGCHGCHRVVGESSQIAMPECGIGLIPDVGGTLMLAKAPGRLGEYLGITGARMNAWDAIYAGFADHYIPQSMWTSVVEELQTAGTVDAIEKAAKPLEKSTLEGHQDQINRLFAADRLEAVRETLAADPGDFAQQALKQLSRNAPLSMASTLELLRRLRDPAPTMARALDLEYRFTSRATEHGDFLEGIRAAIIDKDRNPTWQFADLAVPDDRISQMLAPLGPDALKL